jgi:hypothetical protein
MSNAAKTLASLATLAALAACGGEPAEQNITIDNNSAGPTEVEALPPDESSATPTDELVNGAVEENGATPTDSY